MVKVIKKKTSDTPGLISVLQIKILVTPISEFFIIPLAKPVTGLPGCLMPMPAVFLKAVVGSQIVAAAKPPDGIGSRLLSNKQSEVSV